MPSSYDMNQLRAGAPTWAASVRAPEKENSFAPAMVSQEEERAGAACRHEAPQAVVAPVPRSATAPLEQDRRGRSCEEEAPPRKSRRQEPAQDAGGLQVAGSERRPRASSQAPKPKPKPKPRPAAKNGQQADRRSRPPARRRQQPRRAPLPAAKRELLVSVDVTEQRVAVLEDERVAEVYLERPERRSIAGNIYKGVVDNVLPGDGGGVRRDRPREERLPVRRRDRRPGARRAAGRAAGGSPT